MALSMFLSDVSFCMLNLGTTHGLQEVGGVISRVVVWSMSGGKLESATRTQMKTLPSLVCCSSPRQQSKISFSARATTSANYIVVEQSKTVVNSST
jgi:hypothetical protein